MDLSNEFHRGKKRFLPEEMEMDMAKEKIILLKLVFIYTT